MSEQPDLFVVCKNCSAEVSPYVTECPYCGQRVRKRAPKIDREGGAPLPPLAEDDLPPPPPPPRKSNIPRPRMRPAGGTVPSVAPDTRPYAVYGLISVSLLFTLILAARPDLLLRLGVVGPLEEEWWRPLAAPFLHANTGYQFVTLVATGVFGMHYERRFGAVATLAVFIVAGVSGAALSAAVGAYWAIGANGAALGLLCAWLVDDWRARRRGEDRGSDLIGVYVFGLVLLGLSLAAPGVASPVAAVGGAVSGSLLGFLFSVLKR